MAKPLKEKKRLRRECGRCHKYYTPDGKFQKYCNRCVRNNQKRGIKRFKETIKKVGRYTIQDIKKLKVTKNGFERRD